MPIFDQGYQHWQGTLAGHGWRWLAITRQGVRAGMKNVFVRLLLLGALGPALMLGGGISLWGLVEQKSSWALSILRNFQSLRDLCQEPVAYRMTAWTILFHFFVMIEMWYIMVLVLLVGPSLISQDLRFNALPLYFSRPLRRIDYFIGKLGVVGFFLGVVTIAPAALAWVLGLCFSLDLRAILETFRLLMGMVAFGIIVSLSAGLFILALSSLSRNSRFVAAFWGGMWFITWSVSTILQGIHMETSRHQENEVELRDDWRPIISYTANLQRLGFALIDSQSAWEKVDELRPQAMRDHQFGRFRQRTSLAALMVPQYPWYWSASVLLVLGGVSVWILNQRVSSLDKLR